MKWSQVNWMKVLAIAVMIFVFLGMVLGGLTPSLSCIDEHIRQGQSEFVARDLCVEEQRGDN